MVDWNSFWTEFISPPQQHLLSNQCCPLWNSLLGILYSQLNKCASVQSTVWNSASVPQNFTWIEVISLYLLLT